VIEFKIVEIQKPTKSENSIINTIYVILFGGVTFGIIIGNLWLSLGSFIVGILGLAVFNMFTEDRFQSRTAFKNNDYISFSENGIIINNISYKWNDLSDIIINVNTFKGMVHYIGSSKSRYRGVENNNIKFKCVGVDKEIDFFISDEESYDELRKLLNEIILHKLYLNKTLLNESVIISKLDYDELQTFKKKYDINRYTDFIYYN